MAAAEGDFASGSCGGVSSGRIIVLWLDHVCVVDKQHKGDGVATASVGSTI